MPTMPPPTNERRVALPIDTNPHNDAAQAFIQSNDVLKIEYLKQPAVCVHTYLLAPKRIHSFQHARRTVECILCPSPLCLWRVAIWRSHNVVVCWCARNRCLSVAWCSRQQQRPRMSVLFWVSVVGVCATCVCVCISVCIGAFQFDGDGWTDRRFNIAFITESSLHLLRFVCDSHTIWQTYLLSHVVAVIHFSGFSFSLFVF